MRVLHVESGRHVYGGPRQVLYLVEGLMQRGIDCRLVCAASTPFAAEAKRVGLPTLPVTFGGDLDLGAAGRIRRELRRFDADVLHVHSRRGADTFGALAGWGLPPARVLSRRVDHPESWIGRRFKWPRYQRIVAISEAIRDVLHRQGFPDSRLRCVRSAVDVEALAAQPRADGWRAALELEPDDLLIGMAAQFIERKGHRFAVEAFARLNRAHPRARLLLFGSGPLLDRVRAQVADAGIGRRVRFPGFRDDLAALLPSLDLLVHPALKEGLGVILLQAASCRLPIVAAAAGGIPEAVIDGETGWLVPPGDANALETALGRMLGDAEQRRRMGQAGLNHMRAHFSIDTMVDGNLAVYRELVGAAG